MKPPDGLYFLLTLPSVYRLFSTIVGGDGYRVYISEYVRPVPGEKVLDIGCGPGDILENLPDVDYLGFDINPKYVEAAQKRFGSRGRFFCGDVGLTAIDQEAASFDLVLATGVLHHLDDDRAVTSIQPRPQSTQTGRTAGHVRWLFCGGPAETGAIRREPGSRPICPRIRRIREARGAGLSQVRSFVRHDLLRIPYTHVILQCFSSIPPGRPV